MDQGFHALSEREKETLRLLLVGHDVKSVSARLGLSVHTVNERLREARRKLGVTSSRQAARLLADMEGRTPNYSATSNPGSPPHRRPSEKLSLRIIAVAWAIPSPGSVEECSSCP